MGSSKAKPIPPITTLNSLKPVEWMWKANSDPFSDEEATWNPYSDAENLIIEAAYLSEQPRAILDDYCIDFDSHLQISNNDSDRMRPVMRVVRESEVEKLRRTEHPFMDLPVSSNRSFSEGYGWVSSFVVEVQKDLNLHPKDIPSKKTNFIPDIVEKAAQGILEEGIHLGKRREAEKMAEILLKKKHKGMEEVWQCCAYLYCLETFLYKSLNAAMRLVGSEDHEAIWRSKVRTLGPFCLLLWDDPFNRTLTMNKTLYRGARLSPDQIKAYIEMATKKDEYRSFQSFSSTSRNRSKAELFGNVLFIMEVEFAFIADLSEISEYREEEEELITPGVSFYVQSVDFNQEQNKHLIHLALRQRFSSECKNRM